MADWENEKASTTGYVEATDKQVHTRAKCQHTGESKSQFTPERQHRNTGNAQLQKKKEKQTTKTNKSSK